MKTIKVLIAGVAVFAMSATMFAQQKQWVVPDNFKSMKNPVAQGDVSNKAGMALYNKNCASCHGKTGLGDGVKARSIKTSTGDFSKPEFQKQADGELFYKTKNGHGDMPKYEGKLADNDIWNIVNYMRTFKK